VFPIDTDGNRTVDPKWLQEQRRNVEQQQDDVKNRIYTTSDSESAHGASAKGECKFNS
jgi:hypothetical protein